MKYLIKNVDCIIKSWLQSFFTATSNATNAKQNKVSDPNEEQWNRTIIIQESNHLWYLTNIYYFYCQKN